MSKEQSYNILITGCNSGVGLYLANKFAKQNKKNKVFCCSRKSNNILKEIKLNKLNNVFFYNCDVSKINDIKKLKKKILKKTNKIDILINSAAVIGSVEKIHNCNVKEWMSALKINLIGTFLTIKVFFDLIYRSSHKFIFNFSGGGAFSDFDSFSAYAISKAGVVRLTECISSEYKKIKIFCLAPGFISTQIHNKIFLNKKKTNKEYFSFLKKNYDQKKNMIKLNNLYECIQFLLTKKGIIFKGRTLSVNFDPWRSEKFLKEIKKKNNSDIYKLRRINLNNL